MKAKSIVQTSENAWSWIPTQKAIREDSVTGVIIAACFVFTIILFSTQNIVMALMVCLCLYSIVVTILAIMTISGWKFGITEVIIMVVVMGLAVDNTVHVAHDYINAPHILRNGKMRQAYLQKGKTISSASLNTLICACFMFGA